MIDIVSCRAAGHITCRKMVSRQEVKIIMKRLYRSKDQRMIAGVAGGIGEYFDIDPTIVRIALLLLLLPGFFPGILFYLILWVIIPPKPMEA